MHKKHLYYHFLQQIHLAKFQRACIQLEHLTVRISATVWRLRHARKSSMQRSLEMTLTVLEGVRGMFLDYINWKGEELDGILDRLEQID